MSNIPKSLQIRDIFLKMLLVADDDFKKKKINYEEFTNKQLKFLMDKRRQKFINKDYTVNYLRNDDAKNWKRIGSQPQITKKMIKKKSIKKKITKRKAKTKTKTKIQNKSVKRPKNLENWIKGDLPTSRSQRIRKPPVKHDYYYP